MTALNRPFLICAVIATSCLGACATVDLQTMASGSSDADVAVVEPETNVVQRAVERLQAVFASRGLTAAKSEKRMQAATNLLLGGLSARQTDTPENPYLTLPTSTILEDVATVCRNLDQTHDAADVYLALATPDRDLSDELESLQSAVLASERASRLFSEALPTGHEDELNALTGSVDSLRAVTDRFGERVRMKRSSTLAVNAAAS